MPAASLRFALDCRGLPTAVKVADPRADY